MTLTALVTPFLTNSEIDWSSLENLLHFQLDSEIDGLIALCTTSETPTLNRSEQLEIAKFVLKINQKYNKKIYFGLAGSNTNQVKQDIIEFDNLSGSQGFLISSPSYNKPPQAGLVKHFLELDKATTKEIIVYNVPGRTGVNLQPESLVQILKSSQNIVAVKEACGDLDQIQEVINLTKLDFPNFQILSGDDALTVDILVSGGHGVVSVASNLYPNEIARMVNSANKDLKTSRILEARFSQFFSDCFIQSNPIPIKYFLSQHKIIQTDQVRMPLVSYSELEKIQKKVKRLTSLVSAF